MRPSQPNEKYLWLVCGVLLAGWIAAIVANFGLQNIWTTIPSSTSGWPVLYRLLLLVAILVLAIIVLGWQFFRIAAAEASKQAISERHYRFALEEVYRGTLQALTSALDMRDGDTYGHSRRVMGYSLAIGNRLDLDAREMQTLAWGALLHDLGKIGIPDNILLKEDSLTPEERAVMNSHVTIGYHMVQNIPFLSRASTIIRYHHERYDGEGYPEGLAGEQIPMMARIFSVADAYDAMTSARPYRPNPLDHQAALQVIRSGAGTQFCPKVVEIFCQIPETELQEIRNLSYTPMDDLSALVWLAEDPDIQTPSFYRDSLTGTQNRAAWEAKKSEMTLVKGRALGTVVFLDVDGMKQVNDTYGHLYGDRILSDLGTRLIQLTPDAYRVGGDEFVVWFPAEDWTKDAELALADTLKLFANYWKQILPTISVSWGVSSANPATTSITELVQEADANMYQCKARHHTN